MGVLDKGEDPEKNKDTEKAAMDDFDIGDVVVFRNPPKTQYSVIGKTDDKIIILDHDEKREVDPRDLKGSDEIIGTDYN
jgi:hypothetical protein